MTVRLFNNFDFWRGKIPYHMPFYLFLSIFWLTVLVFFLLFADFLVLKSHLQPDQLYSLDAMIPPFWQEGAQLGYHLGTDEFGRGVFSRLSYATKLTCSMSLSAALLSGIFGSFLGLLVGFYRGKANRYLLNFMYFGFPFFALLVSIVFIFTLKGTMPSFVVIIISVQWVYFYQKVQSWVCLQMQINYVDSARIIGFNDWQILVSEILPNCWKLIFSLLLISIATSMVAEAVISFFGMTPDHYLTWGMMLVSGMNQVNGAWWVVMFPFMMLVLSVIALNYLGKRLQQTLEFEM